MGIPLSKGSTSKHSNQNSTRKQSHAEPSQTVESGVMPLFRKSSTSAKKRLQHQQYLARESPEKTFDISKCELSDVPQGTFSLCKVLQKEALLLNSNWLTSLKGGGEFRDLQNIQILDLHDNELSELPDDMRLLTGLAVLNLEKNKLKHWPECVFEMKSLQNLNIKNNKIKDVPGEIQNLQSLRHLDVSENHVSRLPDDLARVRTLETLVVDIDKMTYPSADVCSKGTEAIMSELCTACGLTYEPPSKHFLDVMDGRSSAPVSPTKLSNFDSINDTVSQYQIAKLARQKELMMLERQMEEETRLQAKLAIEAKRNKQHLIDYVAQDQERVLGELSAIQQVKDREHQQLVQCLHEAETKASNLVENLLEENERAKRAEEIMEMMEKERIESEEWFKVRQEELDQLRKQEVLDAMQRCLAEREAMNQLLKTYFHNQDLLRRTAMKVNDQSDGVLESIINEKQTEKKKFVEHLLTQEKLQKEAFRALQLQQDSKHARISSQIDLIQKELSQLTAVEIQQRELREEQQRDILQQKRLTLAKLLMQLIEEKDKRETELTNRLVEMEEQREANQADYWLVQYQRLMDRKPQALINQEMKLEFAVIEILESAGAHGYVERFARHRVTIETLCCLTDDDLKQMGMFELGLRKAVLREVEKYLELNDRARVKAKELELDDKGEKVVSLPADYGASGGAGDVPRADTLPPSAPPSETKERNRGTHSSPTRLSPSSPPPLEIVARGINSECVICMDNLSAVLFLFCGHVCCCAKCAGPLEECPMCRGNIVHQIILTI